MYLACGTRLDITFVPGQLSSHNIDLRNGHLQAAKRLVEYFCGTIKMSLVFGQELGNCLHRDFPPYGLISFADSNFVERLQ